jgi:hypothetical protein
MLVTMLLSYADDDTMGDLVVARCRCRVMLATALPGRLGRDAMYMLSHAGDNVAESC